MTALKRLMVTQDIRFRVLAEEWQRLRRPFAGLCYGHQSLTVGRLVADLELIAKCLEPEAVADNVIHLPL